MAAQHTPGPWVWHTGNSWRRLKHESRGLRLNVLEPFVAVDKRPDLTMSDADMALIASSPALLTALREVRGFVAAELDVRFRSCCVCDPITGEPDPSTLDDEGECAEAHQALAIIDAAIAEATRP